jgi:hypothetical protein
MWLSLFTISSAAAIGLSIAAVLIQGIGGKESFRN